MSDLSKVEVFDVQMEPEHFPYKIYLPLTTISLASHLGLLYPVIVAMTRHTPTQGFTNMTASTKIIAPIAIVQTPTLSIAQRIAAAKDALTNAEAKRVADIAAKNKSGAKYARHMKRKATQLIATLEAERDAKKASKPAPKAKVTKPAETAAA